MNPSARPGDLPARGPTGTPFTHTVTVFTPVSDNVRNHHTPLTVPAHVKFTRCAVSTAY